MDNRFESIIKQSLTTIERLENRIKEPIAIIGAGCRLPRQVNSLAAMKELLLAKESAIGPIPSHRFDLDKVYSPTQGRKGKMYVRNGGFVDGIDLFDAGFFNIQPNEAKAMDPQQRVSLEVVWETLENAGIPPSSVFGTKVGLYLGYMNDDYFYQQIKQPIETISPYTTTGNGPNMVVGRISHTFGFEGPSLAIQTACSSSLAAIHLAVEGLRSRSCDLALAGGVNLIISPEIYVLLSQIGALSPDGVCSPFDKKANGYVRSEGCGMIALKRLSDAEADGDRILALIRGSAINHDGHSAGITVPNGSAQRRLLSSALANAGVSPAEVGYLEAHGTGTRLGDPIEMNAIKGVFAKGARDSDLLVGSLKSNFGHLEAASGITSILKCLLSLNERLIFPNLNFSALNDDIDLSDSRIKIAQELQPWASSSRICGVSSFGLSGTNAHVILQNYQNAEPESKAPKKPYLLAFSAKTMPSLQKSLETFSSTLVDEESCEALAYTSTRGRDHFSHRRFIVGQTPKDLQTAAVEALRTLTSAEKKLGTAPGKLVMVCSGQGSQWLGMGQAFYRDFAAFRAKSHEVDAILSKHYGFSILDLLLSSENTEQLTRTSLVQPLIFLFQLAMAEVWFKAGLQPAALIGHSFGEISAACIGSLLTLDDACRLIYLRSTLMEPVKGKMLQIEVAKDKLLAAAWFDPSSLSIAAINAPHSTVVAGSAQAIEACLAAAGKEGWGATLLKVENPFHSKEMLAVAQDFKNRIGIIPAKNPTIPIFSTVISDYLSVTNCDADYWSRNISEPVLFAPAIEMLSKAGFHTVIENAPHPVLSKCILDIAGRSTLITDSGRKGPENLQSFLKSLGKLYQSGADIDWSQIYEKRHVAPTVTYAWDRKSYWNGTNPIISSKPAESRNRLLGNALSLPLKDVLIYENRIKLDRFSYLQGHKALGGIIFPLAGFCEMAVAAAMELDGYQAGMTLENLQVLSPLRMGSEVDVVTKVQKSRHSSQFEIYSRSASGMVLHAKGSIKAAFLPSGRTLPVNSAFEDIPVDGFYSDLSEIGIVYEDNFRCLKRLAFHGNMVRGSAEIQPTQMHESVVHPCLIDSCMQVTAAVIARMDPSGSLYLPTRMDELAIAEPFAGHKIEIEATVAANGDTSFSADIIATSEGREIMRLSGLNLQNTVPPAKRAFSARDFYGFASTVHQPLVTSSTDPIVLIGRRSNAAEAIHRQANAQNHAVFWLENLNQIEVHLPSLRSSKNPHIVYVDALDSRTDLTSNRSVSADVFKMVEAVQLIFARSDLATASYTILSAEARHAADPQLIGKMLHGVGRVMANEYPGLMVKNIVLLDSHDPRLALDAILCQSKETELEVGAREIRARRMQRVTLEAEGWQKLDLGQGTCLISGGLGGIGLLAAGKILSEGCRNLVLISRSGLTEKNRDAFDSLQSAHPKALIKVLQADINNAHDLAAKLTELQSTMPAVQHVIHAAGVIEDKLLRYQTLADFQKVLSPKVSGALNLLNALDESQLKSFCLFSSLSSVFGGAGQANYAAANAFVDAFASQLRLQGIPASSINWGPWENLGMTSHLTESDRERMAGFGVKNINPAMGIEALGHALAADQMQLCFVDIHWPTAAKNISQIRKSAMYEALLPGAAATMLDPMPRQDPVGGRKWQAESPAALDRMISDLISTALHSVTGSNSSYDSHMPLSDQGISSLHAIELKDFLESSLDMELSPTLIFDYPTLSELKAYLISRTDGNAQPNDWIKEFARLPPQKREAASLEMVENALKKVTGKMERYDYFIPLRDQGIESLGAIELKDVLESELGLEISQTLVFDYPSMSAIAEYIRSLVAPDTQAVRSTPEQEKDSVNSSKLTEDDLIRILMSEVLTD